MDCNPPDIDQLMATMRKCKCSNAPALRRRVCSALAAKHTVQVVGQEHNLYAEQQEAVAGLLCLPGDKSVGLLCGRMCFE